MTVGAADEHYRVTPAPPSLGSGAEGKWSVMHGEAFVAGYWDDREVAEDYAEALNRARRRRCAHAELL